MKKGKDQIPFQAPKKKKSNLLVAKISIFDAAVTPETEVPVPKI